MILIHQRHRQTDGQTDGRHAISIPRYALVHRAVKISQYLMKIWMRVWCLLFRSESDLISLLTLFFFFLFLSGWLSSKKAQGSVVSSQIGMKFGRNVVLVNTHWLTESDFWFDILSSWWVKLRRIELLMTLYLRATGCRLPYGITRTNKHTRLNPSQRLVLSSCNGRLSWPRWSTGYIPHMVTYPVSVLTQQCTARSRTCDLLVTSPMP